MWWMVWMLACGTPEVTPPQAPMTAEGLRAHLRAHHPDDLPTADALATLPNAADVLWQVADGDDVAGIRARALSLVGHVADDDDLARLRTVLDDADALPGVRAGALRGLAHAGAPDLGARLGAAVHGPPGLAHTAIAILAARDRSALAAIAADPTVDPSIRARAAALR